MSVSLQQVYIACATELDCAGFETHIIGKFIGFQSEHRGSETCALPDDLETQKKVFRAVGTPQPTRALCLGLGSFSRHQEQAHKSSVQLYAFKAMLKGFDIPESKAIVHDPAFSIVDRLFVQSFGMSTQADPESALQELVCEEPTLIFQPFLPFRVMELVLKQNWSPCLLKNVLLLGTKLDGWLNDHLLKQAWYKHDLEYSYIPRWDRCLPLFNIEPLTKREYVICESIEPQEDRIAVSLTAARLTEFRFQWIPTYRVYAAGEQFWKILKLEDSTWRHRDEESDEEKQSPIKSKL